MNTSSLELVRLGRLMELSRGRREIVIGLIDGPVMVGHVDFTGQSIRELGAKIGASCSLDTSVACQHGTFVAGMLCARTGSTTPGICPDCTLLVRPIFAESSGEAADAPHATPEELADAVTDSIEAGAHVLNLSAAIQISSIHGARKLELALDLAARAGVLVVAAAGNQGWVGSTAITRHPWVIPVVGSDHLGRPTSDSNLGRSIGMRGVRAPAANIMSLGTVGVPTTFSGTSVAAPFVSGTLALLWSLFPDAKAAELKLAITNSNGQRRNSIVPPLLNAWAAYDLAFGARG